MKLFLPVSLFLAFILTSCGEDNRSVSNHSVPGHHSHWNAPQGQYFRVNVPAGYPQGQIYLYLTDQWGNILSPVDYRTGQNFNSQYYYYQGNSRNFSFNWQPNYFSYYNYNYSHNSAPYGYVRAFVCPLGFSGCTANQAIYDFGVQSVTGWYVYFY